MVTAVIIDDEKKSRDVLKRLINETGLDVNILNEASSVEGGYSVITKESPDLIFLDVEMLDGTGFNLLEKFNSINFKIIFITAYDQYAIKAFKYSAIDYLLKPIDIDDLESAIIRVEDHLNEQENINAQVLTLLHTINQEKSIKKLIINSSSKIEVVNIDDIICCKAEESYTNLVMVNNVHLTASKPLNHFNLVLKDNENFIRTDKSCLINVDHLKSYQKDINVIKLIDGNEANLARRRKKEFLEKLESL